MKAHTFILLLLSLQFAAEQSILEDLNYLDKLFNITKSTSTASTPHPLADDYPEFQLGEQIDYRLKSRWPEMVGKHVDEVVAYFEVNETDVKTIYAEVSLNSWRRRVEIPKRVRIFHNRCFIVVLIPRRG